MRILLIEDERELAAALAVALSKYGIVIDHTTHLADTAELAPQNDYGAILLDRRLPDGERLSFIPQLRRIGQDAPIIVLTARNEPMERVEGLDTGADDYLGKPFLVEELMARLRAVLRRPAALAELQIKVGRMALDPLNLKQRTTWKGKLQGLVAGLSGARATYKYAPWGAYVAGAFALSLFGSGPDGQFGTCRVEAHAGGKGSRPWPWAHVANRPRMMARHESRCCTGRDRKGIRTVCMP